MLRGLSLAVYNDNRNYFHGMARVVQTRTALFTERQFLMQHKPAPPSEPDAAAPYKTRLGLILFVIYGLFYVGFVAINAISPKTMGVIVVGGLNLAVVYGFGLIILAIVLGLIYHVLCVRAEDRLNGTDEEIDS
jgi:uncharacterized membrane protein (DUF485 family)